MCVRFFYAVAIGLLFFISTSLQAEPVFNVKDFGAVGDGTTRDTQAIQAAIDRCTESGGGRVVFPRGTFLSGTISLKDNVALELTPSAVLLGSTDLDDYSGKGGTDRSGETGKRALIRAHRAANIAIIGRGTIHGSGEAPIFAEEKKREMQREKTKGSRETIRPFGINFSQCKQVKLKEFTLKNSAFWSISLNECDFVTVDDITVAARIVANNDGIDIVDCHHTSLSNSYFDCGDDAICPKSHAARGVKNLTITNCIVKSEANGIKFGTKGIGGFENVTVSNCIVHDTNLAGIALEMVDGGVLDRFTITNIVMKNVNGGIFIKLGNRYGEKGTLRNVIISNVIAEGIGSRTPNTEDHYWRKARDPRIGMTVIGQEGAPIENILLANIMLRFAGTGTAEDAKLPELKDSFPAGYPEYTNCGITPAYGINCRHIHNLQLDNVSIGFHESDARAALFLQDCREIRINALRSDITDKAPAFIRAVDVDDLFITGCKPKQAKIPFLSLEGANRDISLIGNDFSRIPASHHSAPNTSPDEVTSVGNR